MLAKELDRMHLSSVFAWFIKKRLTGRSLTMKMNEVNILMLGAENVGKSALTVRFLTKRFIGEYNSEGDTIYSHTVDLEDEQYNVSVMDTCSKTGNSRNLAGQIRWSDAVVLVYDVSSQKSFDVMRDQLQRVKDLNKKNIPTAIFANKIDLHPRAHVVDQQGARQLAEEYGCLFFVVSAADDWLEISRAFKVLFQLVEIKEKSIWSPTKLRYRRGSVRRHVAHKFLQVISWHSKSR